MTHKKKTPEELEIAAHNRLKGTISYHIASAISQLTVLNEKLNAYLAGCTEIEETQKVTKTLLALYPISAAMKRFKTYTYTQLSIGESPSSARNRHPRKKIKPYGT